MSKQKTKLAVAISDIHYSVNNLRLADSALRAALAKAEELNIPLIVSGDLSDTKAIIRAECANALIETLEGAGVPVFVLVGNHDRINEKADAHALNFLRPYVTVVDKVMRYPEMLGVTFIPYQHDTDALKRILKEEILPDQVLFIHQGVQGAAMGDYVVDKSSIPVSYLKDWTCISGHYHHHQTLGTLTYIGSPYTITFGEATDGPKGFLIINTDGTFTREILNLRRHIIIEETASNLLKMTKIDARPEDLVWIKVSGTVSELNAIRKKEVSDKLLGGDMNFKLDKIPTEVAALEIKKKDDTDIEILDSIIDRIKDSYEYRQYLKNLWRKIV